MVSPLRDSHRKYVQDIKYISKVAHPPTVAVIFVKRDVWSSLATITLVCVVKLERFIKIYEGR